MKNTNIITSFFILAVSATVLGRVDLNDVVNLGKWSKSDLLELVNKDNYSYHQSLLREKLADSIMQHGISSLPLDFENAKVLASLTGSYTVTYLNSAHQVTDERIRSALVKVLETTFSTITLTPKVIGNQAKRSLKAAAEESVEKAIRTIGLSSYAGGELFQEFEKRFVALFALAYMAQPSFCESFTRLYLEIMNTSATAETFLSKEQFLELMDEEIGPGSGVEHLWEAMMLNLVLSRISR